MGRQKGEQFHRSNPPLIRTVAPYGDRFADGTPENPFCPESAADQQFDGALSQAARSMGVPENEADQERSRIIEVRPGVYPQESYRVPVAGSWFHRALGKVVFPAGTIFSRSLSPAVFGSPTIPAICAFDVEGKALWFLDDGEIVLNDTGSRPGGALYYLERVLAEKIDQGGGSASTPTDLEMDQCAFAGAGGTSIDLIDMRIADAHRLLCSANVQIEELGYIAGCNFEDLVTVISAPGVPFPGMFHTRFAGDFEGPAGSALFDATTQALFGGSFIGAAGPDDYIDSEFLYLFFDGGQDLASSTTSNWYGTIPADGELQELHAQIKTAATSVGNIDATAEVAGTNILNATPFDVETLVAGAYTNIPLDSPPIAVTEGQAIEIAVATGAALVGGAGLRWTLKMKLS
jgi:hypothetical protein